MFRPYQEMQSLAKMAYFVEVFSLEHRPSSCKFWKSKAWAKKFAQRHAGPEYTIKFVYAGDSVDCFGNVTS